MSYFIYTSQNIRCFIVYIVILVFDHFRKQGIVLYFDFLP